MAVEKMKRCATCGLDMVAYVPSCPRCGSNTFYALQLCCPVCNHPVQEGTGCCPHCGTALAVQQPPMRPCPGCGVPLPVGASGCQRCGWSPTPQRPVQPQKKKRNLAWLWLFVLIPVLVVCIFVLGGLNGFDWPDPSLQYQPSTTAGTSSDPGNQPTSIPTQPTTWPVQQTSKPSQPTQLPTQPVSPTTQPTDPLPDNDPLPEELRGNLYLDSMGDGYCEEMTGTVMVTIIFLSDPISSWDSTGISSAKTQFDSDILLLEKEAASYGAELDLQITYLESTIQTAYKREDTLKVWAHAALNLHGLGEKFYDQSKLEKYYGTDQAPIVYVLNRAGRAYAVSASSGKTVEYAVLFNDGNYAFRHELSHIFGAKDYYYPEEATAAAEQFLPGSLMMESSSGAVDELTAYLIGWTDVLTPNAEAFLRATNHFTEEFLNQEHEKETLTGYGTKEFSDGVYTGYMDFGVPHGEGTFVGNNGVTYAGSWEQGERVGYGELTSSSGYAYKGQWKNNVFHGQGTVVYSSGDTYTGEFVNGKFSGQGTYTWSNGTTYEGDWVDGNRHGQGKMTWTNGSYYIGAWENDIQNGYGVYYYAQYNTRYEGDFVNGKRHGWGTYYYADGKTYTGKWENDARVD